MESSPGNGLTEDTLLKGRVRLLQPAIGLRAGLDAVVLAASIPAQPGEVVLEAGCGSGAGFLCLMARVPSLRIIAIERDAGLVDLARRNAALNGVADRVTIIEGDVATLPHLPGHDEIRHAFANPPYWPSGTRPPTPLRAAATHAEAEIDLDVWARAMASALARRASLTFILPAERHSDGAAALRSAHCFGVELMPLWPRSGTAAKRVLLRGRRFSRSPDSIHSGLVLHAENSWSPAARRLLEGGEALLWK